MDNNIHWIQIEPTTCCNLSCIYCDHTIKKMSSIHMARELMNCIITGLKYFKELRSVLIQGFGEPFLYPNLLPMVRLIRHTYPHISIQLVTNGMINTETIKEIIKYINTLYVSVDSLAQSYWSNVRMGGNIDTITNNVKMFCEINPNLKVIINTVLLRTNEKEIDDLVKYVYDNGLYGIQFIPLFSTNQTTQGVSSFPHAKKNIELIHKKYPSVSIYVPDSLGCEKACKWEQHGIYILATGEVTPCCVQSDKEDFSFGNLTTTSMEEIIKNRQQKRFDSQTDSQCHACREIKFYEIWNDKYALPLIAPLII